MPRGGDESDKVMTMKDGGVVAPPCNEGGGHVTTADNQVGTSVTWALMWRVTGTG